MRKVDFATERQRFSIRKYSFGAASVLLGSVLFLGGPVLADEQAGTQVTFQDNPTLVSRGDQSASTVDATEVILSRASTVEHVSSQGLADVTEVSTTVSVAVSESVLTSDLSLASSSEVASPVTSATSTVLSEVSSAPVTSEVITSESASVGRSPSELVENRAASDATSTDQARSGQALSSETGSSGFRRMVETEASDGSLELPATGTFVFRGLTDIKTAPRVDLKPTYIFSKGDHVIYDKVLKADGHQWISYISYEGDRYYADIKTLKTAPTSGRQANAEALAEKGTYHFTQTVAVKNQPSLVAKTEFTFDPGMSVNYDGTLKADDHQWLTYVSYSGQRRYVDLGATRTAVVKPSGDLTIQHKDNGDFDVLISNVSDQNGILGVRVPVWSEHKGQDDIIWYNATQLRDGNYIAHVRLSDHMNDRGSYNVHLYYLETNGKLVGVGGTTTKVAAEHVTKVAGRIQVGNLSLDGFDIRITDVASPSPIQQVQVPVWSNKADQDDLVWHLAHKEADGSYKVRVNTSDHKGDVGDYTIHLYYVLDGKQVGVTGTSVTVPSPAEPKGEISMQNHDNGDFSVIITNVGDSKGVRTVKVPIWTVKDDQDDIIWYDATKRSDGSYKVDVRLADHKNEVGDYNIHLYYVENSGRLVGVAGTKTHIAKATSTEMTTLPASGRYTFTERASIKAEPRLASPELAYYPRGASVNYDKVLTADGHQWISYISYTGNRRYIAVSESQTSLSKPTGQLSIVNQTAQGFDVLITNVSAGDAKIQEVQVPVWSQTNGQDDLVWNRALRQSDGSYKTHVAISDHKGNAGEYLVHLYYIINGKQVGVTGTSTTIPAVASPQNNSERAEAGRYTVTDRLVVKNQARADAPVAFYYNAGDSFNYDRRISADGYEWLSYVSNSGQRRYVQLEVTSSQPARQSLATSGRYTFSQRASIKSDTNPASQELAHYDAGASVNYDKTLVANGHTWISYISYSGARRYIAVA